MTVNAAPFIRVVNLSSNPGGLYGHREGFQESPRRRGEEDDRVHAECQGNLRGTQHGPRHHDLQSSPAGLRPSSQLREGAHRRYQERQEADFRSGPEHRTARPPGREAAGGSLHQDRERRPRALRRHRSSDPRDRRNRARARVRHDSRPPGNLPQDRGQRGSAIHGHRRGLRRGGELHAEPPQGSRDGGGAGTQQDGDVGAQPPHRRAHVGARARGGGLTVAQPPHENPTRYSWGFHMV